VFFLCLFILALPACSDQEKIAPQDEKKPEKSLLIGLIPEQNIFSQLDRYEPLAEYLSQKIGMKINLVILTRYGNIVDNFISTELDGAFFGSFTYAQAHGLLGVEVVARPVDLDGSSTYHGMIIARKDSGIKTVADMRGKIFALVDEETTAGYLFPVIYFKKHGVIDMKEYLKEVYFAGTHEGVINDVLNMKADVGAAKNTVFNRIALADERINAELTVLAYSLEVPENALALRKDLDQSIKILLKDALLNMHRGDAGLKILKRFGAKKFIETMESDYVPTFEYAREMNLHFGAYDYKKKHLGP
jgi:phosphonate transport system substrate-binding protein